MNKYILILATLCTLVGGLVKFNLQHSKSKPCVFRSVMNEDPVDRNPVFVPTSAINTSINEGLDWLKEAQRDNGAWGCGSHRRQNVRNPHAVEVDPATTAMVAMTLLRSGSTLEEGPYSKELQKATKYLLDVIDKSVPDGSNITNLTGTQIQRKLGQNIDLVLTTQFLSNLLDYLKEDDPLRTEVDQKLNMCVDKIQLAQNNNGSLRGGTWAGVLQSSLANSALESAQEKGAAVDVNKLKKSQKYQRANYDLETEEVSTSDGAGVILYSVSGSVRASAQDAKKAKNMIKEANASGLLKDEEINVQNLMKSGLDEEEAMELNTSYKVYQSAKVKAQRDEVMTGFGNNGGEEFLSFLQTGESLIINEDEEWSNWYDNISKTILDIQNNDGSWNGHHCITSPVFCTATCVSILTINNDIDQIKNGSGMSNK